MSNARTTNLPAAATAAEHNAYFASGTNNPGEIRGFDAIGHAIGTPYGSSASPHTAASAPQWVAA